MYADSTMTVREVDSRRLRVRTIIAPTCIEVGLAKSSGAHMDCVRLWFGPSYNVRRSNASGEARLTFPTACDRVTLLPYTRIGCVTSPCHPEATRFAIEDQAGVATWPPDDDRNYNRARSCTRPVLKRTSYKGNVCPKRRFHLPRLVATKLYHQPTAAHRC
jgi:hypothetical protein